MTREEVETALAQVLSDECGWVGEVEVVRVDFGATSVIRDEDIYDLVFAASFTNDMDRVADGLNAVVGDEEDCCRAIADATQSSADS